MERARTSPRAASPGMPWIVTLLAALIVAAQVALIFAGPERQNWAFAEFAVIPGLYGGQGGAFAHASLLDRLVPLVGHVFLHGGWLHLGLNMIFLLQVAGLVAFRLDDGTGPLRFLTVFFGSAAAGALAYIWINPGSMVPAVGASGAISGMFAAFLLAVRPDWRTALRDRGVLSAGFWFLAINVGLAAAARIGGILPIAWEAHLGGFVGGALLYPLLARPAPAPATPPATGPWG